jgi:hypothetical protein
LQTDKARTAGRVPITCKGVVDEICVSDVDPAALIMAKLIPTPNQSGTTNNFLDTQKGFFNRNNFDNKINWVTSDKTQMFNFEDNEEINAILRPYPAYLAYNRAVAGFDRASNFQGYFVYDLPFGKGQRWATSGVSSALFGGWRLGAVASALTGMPFTVTDSNGNTVNAPGNTQTPNIVAPIQILKGRPNPIAGNCADDSCKYFNVEAFQHVTTPGVLGNAGRDIVRGPGFFELDGSVYRNFRITERFTFQFEANVIGLTNTPHFGNPTSDINNSNFGKITGSLANTKPSLGGSGGEREWLFGGKIVSRNISNNSLTPWQLSKGAAASSSLFSVLRRHPK